MQEFVRALENRIRAISLAHDATSVASGSEIRSLVEQALAQHGVDASKIQLGGPAIKLDAKSFTVLALVVHELVAGSVTGGALAEAGGRVRVMWTLMDAGEAILRWEEQGCGAVLDAHDGLGMAILKRNIPLALDGTADIRADGANFTATFSIPARFIVEASNTPLPETDLRMSMSAERPLEGCSILIIDDHMPTAIELERLLYARGASSIRIGTSSFDAIALLAMGLPDVAILDVVLGNETSMEIAAMLAGQAVPFVFAATEEERASIEDEFAAVAVLPKPIAEETVAAVVKDAMLPEAIRSVLGNLA